MACAGISFQKTQQNASSVVYPGIWQKGNGKVMVLLLSFIFRLNSILPPQITIERL